MIADATAGTLPRLRGIARRSEAWMRRVSATHSESYFSISVNFTALDNMNDAADRPMVIHARAIAGVSGRCAFSSETMRPSAASDLVLHPAPPIAGDESPHDTPKTPFIMGWSRNSSIARIATAAKAPLQAKRRRPINFLSGAAPRCPSRSTPRSATARPRPWCCRAASA